MKYIKAIFSDLSQEEKDRISKLFSQAFPKLNISIPKKDYDLMSITSQKIYLSTLFQAYPTFTRVELRYNPTTLVAVVTELNGDIGKMRETINNNLDKFTVPVTIVHETFAKGE